MFNLKYKMKQTNRQKKVRLHFKFKKWLLKDNEFWYYVISYIIK